ncbi:unnamed protein product [Orchesella dallaii]|uniref:CRAL-TRIO domain-containing protein n=1 Tax=Orchesella dallaii TaxID=48710 RepID=A0ABP1R1J1_9HEXA
MSDLHPESIVEDGLKEMRQYYAEFCDKQKGSVAVRNFLVDAFSDEAVLLRYLIGRKYRPKHAWDTLRSYAEVRFDKYPEMFPAVLPPKEYLFCENKPIFGILKERDSKGRRIAYFQLSGWDTDKCSLEELSILTLPIFERALCDEDCLNNGLIFIQDGSGMGMAHAKHYTMRAMLRYLNIYWYSFPMKVKGVYFVNVPPFLTFLYAMIKPFLPKKLTERFLLSTTSRGFQDLHVRLPPSILPKCLGGTLDTDEAIDPQFLSL